MAPWSTSMSTIARRVGIVLGSFVIAWVVVTLVAKWLFGSGNVLVWVLATVVAAGVYLELLRRDRRLSKLDKGVEPRPRDIAER